MTNKKVGGIYSIEDDQLKWDMMSIMSSGVPCHSLTEFMKKVGGDRTGRFIVCPMPGMYDFDLENVSGSASPIDAMRHHVDLILEGYSFYVWDTKLNRVYCCEKNKYIYQPLEELIEQRVRDRVKATQSVTKLPCPEIESQEDFSQTIFKLIGQAGEMLQEYADQLEDIAQYDDAPDEILKRAERARALAGELFEI